MPDGYVLSEKDLRIVRELYRKFSKMQHYSNAFGRPPEDAFDHEEFHTTEVYAAHTPTGGIPGLTILASSGEGDLPGSADCTIFRMDERNTPGAMDSVAGYTLTVYNFSTEPVEGETWVIIARDKYGKWVVIGTPATGLTCFPAEITGAYEPTTGYDAKRMNIRDDGTFVDHPGGFTTSYVYVPDEYTQHQVGTRGWLCPSPDNAIDSGTGYGGTGTGDDNQRWIFIPVYQNRTHCEDGELIWQLSTDGGNTWTDVETLGVECGTGTGTSPSDPQGITVGGCGWVSGLRPEDCLELTVIDAYGRCASTDDSQRLILTWTGSWWESGAATPGTSASESDDDDFVYPEGQDIVYFYIDGEGVPKLKIGSEFLVWDKCGTVDGTNEPFIDFSGGSEELCGTGTVPECTDNYFTVRIKCVECPLYWYCVATTGSCNGSGTGSLNEYDVIQLTPYEALLLGAAVCDGPFDTEDEAIIGCGFAECQGLGTFNTSTLTISNKTGDCTCLETSLSPTSWGTDEAHFVDGESVCTPPCDPPPGSCLVNQYDLACENGVYVLRANGVAGTLVSFTPSPFSLVVDFGTDTGEFCHDTGATGTGTFRATLTIP